MAKYDSSAAALEALNKIGKLQFFGRGGEGHQASIYRLDMFDGRSYVIYLYEDGNVEYVHKIK